MLDYKINLKRGDKVMDKESIRQNLLACDYDEYLHDEIFKLFENNQITRIRFLLQNHRDTLLNEFS